MARITTTDCERVVPNRFELVLIAAARARALSRGQSPRVSPDGDKPTVIALREIGAAAFDPAELHQCLVNLQRSAVEEKDELDSPNGKVAPSADESRDPASTGAGDTTPTSSPGSVANEDVTKTERSYVRQAHVTQHQRERHRRYQHRPRPVPDAHAISAGLHR